MFALLVTAVLLITGVWTADDRWVITGVIVGVFPAIYLLVSSGIFDNF